MVNEANYVRKRAKPEGEKTRRSSDLILSCNWHSALSSHTLIITGIVPIKKLACLSYVALYGFGGPEIQLDTYDSSPTTQVAPDAPEEPPKSHQNHRSQHVNLNTLKSQQPMRALGRTWCDEQ